MLTILLQTIRTWVHSVIAQLKNDYGLVYTYSTMPSDSELRALPKNTIFRIKGYYDEYDGNGGLYKIVLGNDAKNMIGRILVDIPETQDENGKYNVVNDTIMTYAQKYLVAIDIPDNNATIHVCRYGIKACNKTISSSDTINVDMYSSSNKNGTNAHENSRLIRLLTASAGNGKTLVFPAGRFFFEKTIDLDPRFIYKTSRLDSNNNPIYNDWNANNNSIVGCYMPQVFIDEMGTSNIYNGGTMLFFPWLENGKTAILCGQGNVENLYISGKGYNFNIDRTKIGTNPNSIVNETIPTDNGEEVKCTGIRHVNTYGIIKNVNVTRFYTGYHVGGNVTLEDVYVKKCHNGVYATNDTKIFGLHGWNVHTLAVLYGGLSTINGARVDSCYNVINVQNGSNIILNDIDGDICAGAVLVIGKDNESTTVKGLMINGIHGRHGVKKAYNIQSNPNGYDINNTDDRADLPIIYVKTGTAFYNSSIRMNSAGGGNPLDSPSNYRTPMVAFAFEDFNANSNIYDNTIEVQGINRDNISKLIQTADTVKLRVDSAKGTWFIDGNNIDKALTESEAQAFLQAMNNTPT